jgi:hypothetical protein
MITLSLALLASLSGRSHPRCSFRSAIEDTLMTSSWQGQRSQPVRVIRP